MLKRFLSYYKPHKKIFILDMLAAFTMSVIGIFYPMITRELLNDFMPNKKYTEIIVCGSLLLIVYLMRMGLSYFVQYQGHMMGVRMQEQMRSDLFSHIEKLPISFFDNNETGKIMTRMTSDLFDIVELAHHGPENVLITSTSIIISFAYLMSINVPLSLILLVCVPILIFISSVLRKKMRDAFKKRREANAVINAALESGADELYIVGGLSGRLDHTLSNIYLLEALAEGGISACICDGKNRVRYLKARSSLLIPASEYKYFGLIPADKEVKGVTIDGAKYNLKNAKLERTDPSFAISTEVKENFAMVSSKKGGLFVIESKELSN